MSWICPYCGVENFQDERVGRREPHCRICDEERITPEDLKKEKARMTGKLEREYDELNDRAAGIREHMVAVQNAIDEHTQDLNRLKEDLENLRAEAAPIKCALDEWKGRAIFFEQRDRAFMAERDPHQKKIPFEVPS